MVEALIFRLISWRAKCYSLSMTHQTHIVGRYAPSPTGDLHLGNVRTAVLAWLSARSQKGRFLLRMEDLDTPRVIKGSADKILKDLEWLGLDWDGPVMYQSSRIEAYDAAMSELKRQELVYPCFCSRKDIQQASSAPHGQTAVYSGACRLLSSADQSRRSKNKVPSYRLMVPDFLSQDVGDFIIKRADGLFAYQLAVVVDDLEQGVNEVVRGADLIDSTSRQQYLANVLQGRCLHSVSPINYHHAPLMNDVDGLRMSKRDGSESLDVWRSAGKGSQELLGFLMSSLGLNVKKEKISLLELLDRPQILKSILSTCQ